MNVLIFEPESLGIDPAQYGCGRCGGSSGNFRKQPPEFPNGNGSVIWSRVTTDVERTITLDNSKRPMFMFDLEYPNNAPALAIAAQRKNVYAFNHFEDAWSDIDCGLYDPMWHQGIPEADDFLAGLAHPIPGHVLMPVVYGYERAMMKHKLRRYQDLRQGRRVGLVVTPHDPTTHIEHTVEQHKSGIEYACQQIQIDFIVPWHSMNPVRRDAVLRLAEVAKGVQN